MILNIINNYKPIDYTGTTKVDGKVIDISRRVYQNDGIDWNCVDSEAGLNNKELAEKGFAPYANDGTKIELHHLLQMEPGAMVEIPASLHDEYSKILHQWVKSGESFRNDTTKDKQYNNFKRKYWRWRAKNLQLYEEDIKHV